MVEFRISIQNSVLVLAHGGPCLLLLMPLAFEACSTAKAKGLYFYVYRCVSHCCKYGFGWCLSKFEKTMQLLEKLSVVKQSYQRLISDFICFSWFSDVFFICFNVFSERYQILTSRLQRSCIYWTWMLSKQVQQEMLDQQGIYIWYIDNCWHLLDKPFGRINVCLFVSNIKISITLEANFLPNSINQSFPWLTLPRVMPRRGNVHTWPCALVLHWKKWRKHDSCWTHQKSRWEGAVGKVRWWYDERYGFRMVKM